MELQEDRLLWHCKKMGSKIGFSPVKVVKETAGRFVVCFWDQWHKDWGRERHINKDDMTECHKVFYTKVAAARHFLAEAQGSVDYRQRQQDAIEDEVIALRKRRAEDLAEAIDKRDSFQAENAELLAQD